MLKIYGKKVKKYNLVKLSKEENIRRQIANIIALPLVPPKEVDNCMEKIIDELCNYDSKLEKITDYVIKNYIEDARFSLNMWNHFDTIGERPLRRVSSAIKRKDQNKS